MATTKSWINAARPRTLPLALSGIIMGCGLAWFYGVVQLAVSVLAVVTATLIQVFSNFANDYGDSQRGTDNQFRLGPTRTMQSGEINKKEMETGMLIVGTLSFIFGILLVYFGTWRHSKTAFFSFIGFGILSLLAAYFYTAGKKSYGYIGLGDLFVFLFFGLLPVAGVFYLNTGFLPASIFLPAISIGFFSAGVLNLNNLRDYETDKKTGKRTLVVALGVPKARLYHAFLLLGAYVAVSVFTLLEYSGYWQWIFWASFPLMFKNLRAVQTFTQHVQLFPELKRLSMASLLFAVLLALGLIIQ